MKPSRSAFLTLIILGTGAAALVAVDLSTDSGFLKQALAAPQLPDTELQARLQAQGYTNIQDLRHAGGRVFTTATKDGQTTQVAVNGATGQVGQVDGDDDD